MAYREQSLEILWGTLSIVPWCINCKLKNWDWSRLSFYSDYKTRMFWFQFYASISDVYCCLRNQHIRERIFFSVSWTSAILSHPACINQVPCHCNSIKTFYVKGGRDADPGCYTNHRTNLKKDFVACVMCIIQLSVYWKVM